MKEQDYKFYTKIRHANVSLNDVPKSVKNSLQFQNLFAAKTLDTKKSGRGSVIVIKNKESFELFFSNHFSNDEITAITKSSNIRKLRNSKARRVKTPPIFFMRGFKHVKLNGKNIDLNYYTNTFGVFGVREPLLETDKVCLVENLASFLRAEQLFGRDYIYLHKYGRIGISSLKQIQAKEVLVFVDYDFNGLDEFLRIRSVYESAKLFIPENFVELFDNYSKAIKGKQGQSKRVMASELEEVILIRNLVSKTNYFLEQEILIND